MSSRSLSFTSEGPLRRGSIALAASASILSGVLVALEHLELAIGCAVLFGALFVVSPKRLLIVAASVWAIFWLPFVPTNLFLAFKEFVLLAFLFLTVGLWLVRDRRLFAPLFRTPVSVLLAFLMLTLIPGVLLSDRLLSSLTVWFRFAAAVLIYASLLHLFRSSPQMIGKSFKLLVVSVALSSAHVILVQTGILTHLAPPEQYVGDPGLMSFSYRAIGLSWSISFVVPIGMALLVKAWRERSRARWLWILVNAVFWVACAMTRGRGGLLASFLGTLAILWVLFAGRGRGKILFALAAGALLFLALNPSFVESNLLRGAYSVEQVTGKNPPSDLIETLTSGRVDLWGVGLDHIESSPFLGVGLGRFAARLGGPVLGSSTHLHNLFLAAAVEGGLFAGAAALFLFLYILFFYRPAACGLVDGPEWYWAAASYGIIVASLMASILEIGPMFHSLYLGLPFWFALAAISALRATHRATNQPKAVSPRTSASQ